MFITLREASEHLPCSLWFVWWRHQRLNRYLRHVKDMFNQQEQKTWVQLKQQRSSIDLTHFSLPPVHKQHFCVKAGHQSLQSVTQSTLCPHCYHQTDDTEASAFTCFSFKPSYWLNPDDKQLPHTEPFITLTLGFIRLSRWIWPTYDSMWRLISPSSTTNHTDISLTITGFQKIWSWFDKWLCKLSIEKIIKLSFTLVKKKST